jgi:Protein of unknown function (DUF2589)
VPIRDLSTLGLGQLLGALLSAVVEGQQEATASSLAFVEQVGLLREGEGDERFRTVTIRYTKLDENQEPAEFTLEVPLLAMVSIPTLVVQNAKVSFTYNVTETTTSEPTEGTERLRLPRPLVGDAPRPVILKGFVQPRRPAGDKRETAGVDVEVTVESVPLPLGLERLLELTEFTVSRPAKEET